MDRWIHKLISIFVTFFIPFFFILLPYMLHGFMFRQGERGRTVVAHLMCFGGGIFFGTYLLHMGPEVRYILETTLLGPENISYPVGDLVIGVGFFSVLLMEKIIIKLSRENRKRKRKLLEQNCLIYQSIIREIELDKVKGNIVLKDVGTITGKDVERDDGKDEKPDTGMDVRTHGNGKHKSEESQDIYTSKHHKRNGFGMQKGKEPKACGNCRHGKPCLGLSYIAVSSTPVHGNTKILRASTKTSLCEIESTDPTHLTLERSTFAETPSKSVTSFADEAALDNYNGSSESDIYEVTEFRQLDAAKSDIDSGIVANMTSQDESKPVSDNTTTNGGYSADVNNQVSQPFRKNLKNLKDGDGSNGFNDDNESDVTSSSDDESDIAEEHRGHHQMRSLILVLALSLHHLFEGLTIGLQITTSMLWTLVFAVMCHESIISFSLGLNFVKCDYSLKRHLLASGLVAGIMPIGQAIGIALSETGNQSHALDVASGFLQAFSTGTFLYVTFFEIFLEELDPHEGGLLKVCSAVAGFVVMGLLMIVPENNIESVPPEHTSENSLTTQFFTPQDIRFM